MTNEAVKRKQAIVAYQDQARCGRLEYGYASLICRRCGRADHFVPLGNDIILCEHCGGRQSAPISVYTWARIKAGKLSCECAL